MFEGAQGRRGAGKAWWNGLAVRVALAVLIAALVGVRVVEACSSSGPSPSGVSYDDQYDRAAYTEQFTNEVRYHDGEVLLVAHDLTGWGGEAIGHTRSFKNRLADDFDGPNGFNWHVGQWPYLAESGTDVVSVNLGQTTFWFEEDGGDYVPLSGAVGVRLTHDSGTDTFTFEWDREGGLTTMVFHDFDHHPGGIFKSYEDAAGNVTEVIAYTTDGERIAEIQRSRTAEGATGIEAVVYDYFGIGDNVTRLEHATLRRSSDGISWDDARRATYTYYGTDDDHGSFGDLETVTIREPDGSGGWEDTATSYYRYYKEADADGSDHDLKLAVEPEGFRRLADAEADPLAADDETVKQYAARYFEYDGQGRVTRHVTNDCGCPVAGETAGETFTRTENAAHETYDFNTISRYNAWHTRTVVERGDGTTETVYTNELGQVMLKVLEDEHDNKWIDYFRYGSEHEANEHEGRLILRARPSAVTGFDDNDADLGVTLRANQGLIEVTAYYTDTTATDTTPGSAEGYLHYRAVKEGSSGAEVRISERTYFKRTDGDLKVCPVAEEITYPTGDNQTQVVTAYEYDWVGTSVRMEARRTLLPPVPDSQNGPNDTDVVEAVFDAAGNVIWQMDARGYITRHKYDLTRGVRTQVIQDVDTSLVSDEPSGWTTPADGGLHLVTDFDHDVAGRLIETLGPEHTVDVNGDDPGGDTAVRRATWRVYKHSTGLDEVWTGHGYQEVSGGTNVLIDPVTIELRDKSGSLVERITSRRTTGSGKLSSTDTFDQADRQSWHTHTYDDDGLLLSERVYHDIPASGEGALGTNYEETHYGYDPDTRQRIREQAPGGTITRHVRDPRGLVIETWVGTDDTDATPSDPSGNGAAANNMVLVTEREYDNGSDGGDGHVTKVTRHADATTARITSFEYDFRGRRIVEDGELTRYVETTYDNLGRVIQTDQRDTDDQGNLIARSETMYDDRGRVYRQITHGVDPDTGTIGEALTANRWYDAAGNLIKQIEAGGGSAFTKTSYDSLGRMIAQYTGHDPNEPTSGAHAQAATLTGDIIVEQAEIDYDAAGNAVEVAVYQRHPGETATGALDSASARVSYQATWHDALGRVIASSDYGTNGGSALSRPDAVPDRSDTVLVTSTVHDDAGRQWKVIGPKGIEQRTEHDAAGRQTKVIDNYVDGDPGSGDADEDRTTQYTYTADGETATITAVNDETGDQTTTYHYGTTLTDSDVARADLLRQVEYPDSTGSADRVTQRYNRLGEVVERKDQNATIHVYEFDALGREVHDRVTSINGNTDTAVRRVSKQYDARGLLTKVASHDNASVGQGVVLNEVELEYDGFGNPVAEHQEHDGEVDGSTLKVQYAYTGGADNHTRLTKLTYPDAREIDYTYGGANSIDDALSRVAAIEDGAITLASYTYLGTDTPVRVDYEQPQVRLDHWGGSAGTYDGLDRFGRVTDHRWRNYGSSTDVDRIRHGYDRNSNRLWRENVIAAIEDELYVYDGLDRLVDMRRGVLNAAKDAIATLEFAQDWSLDPVGNWTVFRQDDDGSATWNLDQTRTHNVANEIGTISGGWTDPAHDAAGNMTTIPQPADPTSGYTATYDAWNRLVKLEDGTDTVAEYTYDGRGRRIIKKTYDSGALAETRHLYYTNDWQVIEERVGSSTDAERQFVWGVRYVDDLVLRDRDTTSGGAGTLDERRYALQDANFNVTTIIDASGAVQERFRYTAYGAVTFLDANFAEQTGNESPSAWETLYAGYRFDAESHLYHVRHRVLHPTLGRWLQRDPLGSIDGMNLYLYAGASPNGRVDPGGTSSYAPLTRPTLPWPSPSPQPSPPPPPQPSPPPPPQPVPQPLPSPPLPPNPPPPGPYPGPPPMPMVSPTECQSMVDEAIARVACGGKTKQHATEAGYLCCDAHGSSLTPAEANGCVAAAVSVCMGTSRMLGAILLGLAPIVVLLLSRISRRLHSGATALCCCFLLMLLAGCKPPRVHPSIERVVAVSPTHQQAAVVRRADILEMMHHDITPESIQDVEVAVLDLTTGATRFQVHLAAAARLLGAYFLADEEALVLVSSRDVSRVTLARDDLGEKRTIWKTDLLLRSTLAFDRSRRLLVVSTVDVRMDLPAYSLAIVDLTDGSVATVRLGGRSPHNVIIGEDSLLVRLDDAFYRLPIPRGPQRLGIDALTAVELQPRGTLLGKLNDDTLVWWTDDGHILLKDEDWPLGDTEVREAWISDGTLWLVDQEGRLLCLHHDGLLTISPAIPEELLGADISGDGRLWVARPGQLRVYGCDGSVATYPLPNLTRTFASEH